MGITNRLAAITFGSLFSGIGGMDLGLERAGMECLWQVEIDEFCRKVLARRWPSVPRFTDIDKFCRRVYDCEAENEDGEVICPRCGVEFGDCECIGTDQLIDEYGRPDIIVGGDPCQRNSNAWRHGAGDASLGDQFIRVVDELCPRFVLRENPATVRADAPWPWWRFRSELEYRNYAVVPFRLRACCVGADIKRERLFLFAELQESERERREGDVSEILARADEGRHDTDIARPDRWSATPRVCGRVDGIPHRMDRLKSLGNAVVPQMAQWIGERIIKAERNSNELKFTNQ